MGQSILTHETVRDPSALDAVLDRDPDEVLDEIRYLITDYLLVARDLAAKAAERFPDHAGIQNADRVLNSSKVTVRHGEVGPPRDKEFEWLRHPPKSVYGKWVALLGSELIGASKDLQELVELLRSKNLETKALIHKIDEGW